MPLPMSILLCNDKHHKCNAPYVKCFAVNMGQVESLADFVRRVRREKKLSLNDVVRQSGKRIANSHISRIENGFATNVTPEKLRALAAGLQVSDDDVFAAARGLAVAEAQGPEDLAALFYGWEEATVEERTAAMDAIKMIAESFQRRRMQKKELALNSSPDAGNGNDDEKRLPANGDAEPPQNGQSPKITDTPRRRNHKEIEKKEEPPSSRPRTKRR